MVRRQNTTIFLTCKEGDTVTEVKKMLAGICRQKVGDIRLYQDQDGKGNDCSSLDSGHSVRGSFSMLLTALFLPELEGSRQLSEVGLTAAVCRPQSPGSLLAAWAGEEVSGCRLGWRAALLLESSYSRIDPFPKRRFSAVFS